MIWLMQYSGNKTYINCRRILGGHLSGLFLILQLTLTVPYISSPFILIVQATASFFLI